MGADLTLEFTREVIILEGVPVLGTIEVAVEAELDDYDGLFAIHLICIGFEPETPLAALQWSDVATPCRAWLTQNKDRAERRAMGHE